MGDAIAAAVAYLEGGGRKRRMPMTMGMIEVPAKPSGGHRRGSEQRQAAIIDSVTGMPVNSLGWIPWCRNRRRTSRAG